MRTASRTLFGASSLLAVLAAGALAAGASAQPDPAPPQSGDPRATAVAGNVDMGQPGDACDEVGLPGNEAMLPPGTYTTDGTNITITANPPGYVITGVVVKGGPAYNIYRAADLSPLPWENLHSPLNASGKPAEISHWFVCQDVATTTTTTTTTTTSATTTTTVTTTPGTTTSPPGSTTTTPVKTTTTVPSDRVTTTTTKAAGVVVPGRDDDLAATGFNGWWLIVAGLSLLAAGAGFLASPKLRNLLRR